MDMLMGRGRWGGVVSEGDRADQPGSARAQPDHIEEPIARPAVDRAALFDDEAAAGLWIEAAGVLAPRVPGHLVHG